MFFLLILLSYDNMIKDRVKARPSWKKHRGVKPLMETVTEEMESLKKTCPSLPAGQGGSGIPVPAEAAHKGRAIKTRTWDRTQKSKCGVSSSFVISVSWETR